MTTATVIASACVVTLIAAQLWVLGRCVGLLPAAWPRSAEIGIAIAAALAAILLVSLALVCIHAIVDRCNRHLVIWRRDGAEFAAVRIEAERSGRREIHLLGRWPITGSTTTVAEQLRIDVAAMAKATNTVLTTGRVVPALQKIYLAEGMTLATPDQCRIYDLKPSQDPLILLPS